MPVTIKPTSQIKARLGLEPNGRVQKFFTNECAREMDPFVPFDNGTTAETVVVDGQPIGPGVGIDTITYQTNYAKIIYYGIRNGKEINYHLDKHPKAGPYWDKRMWSAKSSDIIKAVQDYIDRGGR